MNEIPDSIPVEWILALAQQLANYSTSPHLSVIMQEAYRVRAQYYMDVVEAWNFTHLHKDDSVRPEDAYRNPSDQ